VRAAYLAEALGVSAEQALIKHGFLPESTFYRALSDELALPFLADPPVAAVSQPAASILQGLAPLTAPGPRFVTAPAGKALRRLLKSPPLPGLAITTPTILRDAVLARNGETIAKAAADDLPDRAPLMSYRGGMTLQQRLSAAILALIAALAMLDATAMNVTALALAPLFLAMVWTRLGAAMASPPPETRAADLPDRALPIYTVIVALYREAEVVHQLVAALQDLDYPPAKLDIKLVLEEADRDTADALAVLDLPASMEIIVAPRGPPQTKPRALNVALALARGAFTVIYDAEDLPGRRQLRTAAARFAVSGPEVACLQARLSIYDPGRNALTRLFATDYAALFEVINPGLIALGHPILLGGTSNHFRTQVLQVGRGWDAWNVTEDADLSIRLARAGFRIGDLPLSTLEDAPQTLGVWMNQRSRWMKGFMQTCITHSREPARTLRGLGRRNALAALTLTYGTVFSALGYPFFTAWVILGLVDGSLLGFTGGLQAAASSASLLLFALGLVAMTLPAAIVLVRHRHWRLLPWVPVLFVYYLLVSAAAWRGLWDLFKAPSHWHKTDHRRATRPVGEA
jgi:cellulose synthase/poly-beta-1,6-N-acetylglucosamine synthase-like glycosyltransferase